MAATNRLACYSDPADHYSHRVRLVLAEKGVSVEVIDVEAGLEEDAGFIRLTVRDTGAGVDPVHLPRLFERGFSTKRGRTGGLGLHWCANSVAAMAGRIHAESAGRATGAAFHIVLPVHSPDPPAGAAA